MGRGGRAPALPWMPSPAVLSSPTVLASLFLSALLLPSGVRAAWGHWDGGRGARRARDTYWSTTSGICTCSMGMSCSRSSKLCTYWILLMNLTLAEGEGREVAQGPGGTMEDRDTHTSSPRMLEHVGPELPPRPVPASTPCPQRGGESRARGSACRRRVLSQASDLGPR